MRAERGNPRLSPSHLKMRLPPKAAFLFECADGIAKESRPRRAYRDLQGMPRCPLQSDGGYALSPLPAGVRI
jgi:hypothetical protein